MEHQIIGKWVYNIIDRSIYLQHSYKDMGPSKAIPYDGDLYTSEGHKKNIYRDKTKRGER